MNWELSKNYGVCEKWCVVSTDELIHTDSCMREMRARVIGVPDSYRCFCRGSPFKRSLWRAECQREKYTCGTGKWSTLTVLSSQITFTAILSNIQHHIMCNLPRLVHCMSTLWRVLSVAVPSTGTLKKYQDEAGRATCKDCVRNIQWFWPLLSGCG